jgi:glutaredoxin-like YruB-family protein
MVKLYTTPTCPYCKLAKDFLRERNVEFREVDVSQNREALEEMVQKSGQLGVPVIEIGEKIMVGYNRQRLAEVLGVAA